MAVIEKQPAACQVLPENEEKIRQRALDTFAMRGMREGSRLVSRRSSEAQAEFSRLLVEEVKKLGNYIIVKRTGRARS
ncbi:hypothetical protein AMST5_01943 [freshwater sediment metagenome]|uniref:Uncharacterized protein n=1 Tax=freshwater sediment metagenome TaxID=556182 RepID=A0AA48R9Q0_9ZZZZ